MEGVRHAILMGHLLARQAAAAATGTAAAAVKAAAMRAHLCGGFAQMASHPPYGPRWQLGSNQSGS